MQHSGGAVSLSHCRSRPVCLPAIKGRTHRFVPYGTQNVNVLFCSRKSHKAKNIKSLSAAHQPNRRAVAEGVVGVGIAGVESDGPRTVRVARKGRPGPDIRIVSVGEIARIYCWPAATIIYKALQLLQTS